jgi:1,4-dihydroxy-2-naphthoate octaprenyltransferase
VAVGFGLLPVLGVEYVQRGRLSLEVGWLALPAGLLIAAVLLANEFPDIEADASVGKRTLPVRLGPRRAVAIYELLVLGAYVSVAVGVIVGWMPWLAAAVAAVAWLTWRAVRVLRLHHADVRALLPALSATIAQHAIFLLLLTGAYLADLALRAW